MARLALDIREALLKSGKEEFLAHGFEKASLRIICKKAGLTTGAFYAGAFGAIYIVLMLIVVLAASAIPILYIVAPFTVGVVCATVYELCVLKVRKFGPALILGVLFALVACSGNSKSVFIFLSRISGHRFS